MIPAVISKDFARDLEAHNYEQYSMTAIGEGGGTDGCAVSLLFQPKYAVSMKMLVI